MNPHSKLFQLDRSFTARALRTLVVLAAIAFGLVVYLHIVGVQNKLNDRTDRSDQRAYMNFSRKAYLSQFLFTGNRNRMPLYPWIQAVFYAPDLTEEQFFEQGKAINTAISILGIVVIGLAFFRRFTGPFALYGLIVIAFMLFALKAPWFQAEILYYILLWLSFVIAIESIHKRSWFNSLILGVTFALAHFSKASALPGLIVYALSFTVPLIQGLRNHSGQQSNHAKILGYAAAPVAIFAVLLFPYFRESHDRYGHYLYNVNTTFYMWYDSWDEATEGTKKAGDRAGWPDLPADEIPSLAKYMSEHTVEDILHRFSGGAQRLLSTICTRTDSKHKFGNCIHIAAGALIFLAVPAYCFSRKRPQTLGAHLHAGAFALLFFIFYVFAALWHDHIISGPRLMFALILPLYWTFGLVERYAELDGYTYVFFGRQVRPIRIIYGVLIAIAFMQIYELVTFRAATLYGGS